MREYEEGDKVDLDLPPGIVWEVAAINRNGSLYLAASAEDSNAIMLLDYVPRDYVAKATPLVKVGQVWRDDDGDLFIVTDDSYDHDRVSVQYGDLKMSHTLGRFRDFELVAE